MLRSILAGAVALLVFMPAARADDAAAQSRLDQVIAAGVLKVGSTGDYKPFTFKDPSSGEFTGFDIDQMAGLAKALGVKLEIVPTSWPNLMEDFKADKFDMAVGRRLRHLRPAEGRAFLKSLYAGRQDADRALRRQGQVPDPRRHRQAGVTAIANPGGTNEKFDRAHFTKAKIVVFPDNTKIFDEVAAGHADLMITDASETRYQQKLHEGVLCSIHPDKPFDFAEKAYWLQRDPYFKAFVDEWLHQSIKTGAYQAVNDKWFK